MKNEILLLLDIPAFLKSPKTINREGELKTNEE